MIAPVFEGRYLIVMHSVLSPERQCRRQMIPGWPSGHGAVRCGHPVDGDLFEVVV